jgi:hypothetical protein
MSKKIWRIWLFMLGFALIGAFHARTASASMGGVDHLPEYLSVSNFWINGAWGAQAGTGNAGTPGPALPYKWHPGLTVHVKWKVADWKGSGHGGDYEADVPVEPYDIRGNLWVHFLADGSVRVVVFNGGPRTPGYPGPHDPIPDKKPWIKYPPRRDRRDLNESMTDLTIAKQRCAAESDPEACTKQAQEKQLDEQLVDARRYLSPCASADRYTYDACIRHAEQQMQAARLARRCKVAPGLPECTAPQATPTSTRSQQNPGAEE